MSNTADSDDRQDLEYAQRRAAEVNERAAKAVSQLAGIESNAAPNGSLRMAHSDLCTTLANTRRAISRVEQAIAARRDGHGRPMPREVTSEHADRFDELYDGPVYYLAIELLAKNRREFLQAKPDTHGAEQIERHGLTNNQREWLTDFSEAWQAKDHVYDPRTINHVILSDILRTVVSESRNENWGNVRVNLEEALDSFPELVDETVTVACRARPEADYSQWDPYASADPVNRLIRIPTDSHVTNVTLWHELEHLAIRIQDERGEDVPVTSEEYCSLFSVARMPGTAIDEWRIPYLGKPRKRQSRWPNIAERALEYRENHRDYIQTAKTWYSIGPEYDHLSDPWDEREVSERDE